MVKKEARTILIHNQKKGEISIPLFVSVLHHSGA